MRATALKAFHAVENNGNADFDSNGEAWLLRELVATWRHASREPVILDVGANVGGYTQRVLDAAVEGGLRATVHLVEPSSKCVEELSRRLVGRPEVHIHRAAVSESAGTLRLRADAAGSTLASLVERPGIADAAGEEVPVVRLDALLDGIDVVRVDLLKLDVEGAELAALRGLGHWLAPATIPVIQFEYGGTTLDARTSLRDIVALLEAKGYVLAKLFPGALEVRRYAAWMDHFNYANFVAMDEGAIAAR